MSNVVGEIAINVTADVGPLMRQIGRGTDAMQGMQRMSASVAGGLKRFGAATTELGKKLSIVSAGIAAITAGTVALVKSAADVGDKIGNSARAAGLGAEAYQEYAFAIGEAADITQDEFDAAMVIMNRRLGEAQKGSKSAAAAFAAIGLSAEDVAAGLVSSEEVLAAWVATVEASDNSAAAAALSADLFGKKGAGMGAMLAGSQGQVAGFVDRARELGLVVSNEFVNASGKFNDQMAELARQFEAVKIKIAEVLLPVIVNQLIPALQETVIPAIVKVIEKLGEWITWFGDLDPAIQSVVGAITTAFAIGGPVLLAIGAVSTAIGALVAATGPVGLFITAAALLGAAWVKWGDDFRTAVGGAIEWVSGKFTAFIDLLDRIIQKAKIVGKAIAESLTGAGPMSIGETNSSLGLNGPTPGADFIQGGSSGGGAGGAMGGQMMGAAIVNGMVLGATQAMEERRQQLTDLFGQVPQIARDVLGIHSPSTVFAEVGNNIGAGMAQGIQESQALVSKAVETMGQTAVTSTAGTVSSILGSMSTLFNGSKKFAIAQALVNAWTGASEALKLPWPENLAAFAKVLATGMNAVKNIKSAQPGSSGGGGGGASAGGGASTPAQAPATTMNFTIQNDPFGYGERFARSLTEQMNAARRNGSQIIATVTSS